MRTNVGENVEAEVDGNKLTLHIDLHAAGTPSKSGKSLVLATTKGAVTVPGSDAIKLNINIYRGR